MAKKTVRDRQKALAATNRAASRAPWDKEPAEIPDSVFAFLALVVVGLFVVVAVWFHSGQIERDLAREAEEALIAAGFDDVFAVVDGRDVTLSGRVKTDGGVGLAESILSDIDGVRVVNNRLVVVAPPVQEITADNAELVPLRVSWTANASEVTGAFGTEEERQRVLDALGSTFATVNSEALVIDDTLPETPWIGSFSALLPLVHAATQEGNLMINPDGKVVVVSGETDRRRTRDQIIERAEELFIDFEVVNAMSLEDRPRPTRQQVEELQVDLNALLEGAIVEFETNSTVIRPKGRELLDQVGALLTQHPDIPVEIAGHADDRGSEEANYALALGRAEAVLTYLVGIGLEGGRFTVLSFGETQPIADNSTAEGRQQNRRIEFTALLEE